MDVITSEFFTVETFIKNGRIAIYVVITLITVLFTVLLSLIQIKNNNNNENENRYVEIGAFISSMFYFILLVLLLVCLGVLIHYINKVNHEASLMNSSKNEYKGDINTLFFVIVIFSLGMLVNVICNAIIAVKAQKNYQNFKNELIMFLILTMAGEFLPLLAVMLLHLKNFRKQ